MLVTCHLEGFVFEMLTIFFFFFFFFFFFLFFFFFFRLRIQYDGLLKEEGEQNEFIEQFVLQK